MILTGEKIILTDEALHAQKTFRVLLNAMAHPGKFYDLSFIGDNSYLYLVLKTLLDCEVTFAVFGTNRERLSREIRLLTGAVESEVEDADFLIITDESSRGEIERAKIGTAEYPDRGATLIYSIEKGNSNPVNLRLAGPGIHGELGLSVYGIAKKEFLTLKGINRNYPLGLDSIFVFGDGKILCLPRSTRILEVS